MKFTIKNNAIVYGYSAAKIRAERKTAKPEAEYFEARRSGRAIVADVNACLKAAGVNAKLRANTACDYCYFTDEPGQDIRNTPNFFYSSAVYVARISDLTVSEWLDAAAEVLKTNRLHHDISEAAKKFIASRDRCACMQETCTRRH